MSLFQSHSNFALLVWCAALHIAILVVYLLYFLHALSCMKCCQGDTRIQSRSLRALVSSYCISVHCCCKRFWGWTPLEAGIYITMQPCVAMRYLPRYSVDELEPGSVCACTSFDMTTTQRVGWQAENWVLHRHSISLCTYIWDIPQ